MLNPIGPTGIQGTTVHSNIPMPTIPNATGNSSGSGHVKMDSVASNNSYVTNWTDSLRKSLLEEFERLQKEARI